MTKKAINTGKKIGEEPEVKNAPFSEEDRAKVMQEIYENQLADNGEKIIGKINREDYMYFTKLNQNHNQIANDLAMNALEKDGILQMLKGNMNDMQSFELQIYEKYNLPENIKYKIDKDMNIIVSVEEYGENKGL